MTDIRDRVLQALRDWWTSFKQKTELHVILGLSLADAVTQIVRRETPISTHPMLQMLLFGYLLVFCFELVEKLTADTPSKDNPRNEDKASSPEGDAPSTGNTPSKDNTPSKGNSRSKRKRPSRNRKSKGNPLSQGSQPPKSKHSSACDPHSKGSSPSKPNAPSNYLAKFVPEIRLQIFKHYFALFRPERYYRESHYKNTESLNLLNALKDDTNNPRLYEEALEQYHKSSHLGLLLNRGGVGKDSIDNLEPWVFRSLKDVTFGPGIIERLMLPDPCLSSTWNSAYDPNDVAERVRVCRWYLLQTVRIFGRNSRLARATDIETLTIFITENGNLELELMNFFLGISSGTFRKLRKMCYCFSATRASKESLEITMLRLFAICWLGSNLQFKMNPWSSVSSGCQHEISGFQWEYTDGKKVEVEFSIYH